jgi:tRNA pseudouridine-54 N-methylase
MKAMRTAYTESRGATVARNEWEGILGRLDVLADEVNRALHLTTRIEEPRSGVRIAHDKSPYEVHI